MNEWVSEWVSVWVSESVSQWASQSTFLVTTLLSTVLLKVSFFHMYLWRGISRSCSNFAYLHIPDGHQNCWIMSRIACFSSVYSFNCTGIKFICICAFFCLQTAYFTARVSTFHLSICSRFPWKLCKYSSFAYSIWLPKWLNCVLNSIFHVYSLQF